MSQGLILFDALSSACWERKEKKKRKKNREVAKGSFPGLEARNALLAVLGKTFVSVS
jgi:hypothetical protein